MDEIGLDYSSEVVQESYHQADNLIELQHNYLPINLLSEKVKEHNQQCRARVTQRCSQALCNDRTQVFVRKQRVISLENIF